MTRKESRKYFEDKNLSYEDITEEDIHTLTTLLRKHLKINCKKTDRLSLSKIIKSKYKTDGSLVRSYLYINGEYFLRRECISFNTDGFIGFAGWASDRNVKPIIDAFVEWCDVLASSKNQVC